MKRNGLRSGVLWWISALMLAGLAGLMTYRLLSTTTPVATGAVLGEETQLVVVAAVDIPFRRSITENDLVVRKFPLDSVPDGAALTLEQVVGKMSTVDIFSGEPVLIQQLVTPDIVTAELALSIPDGRTVVAVPMRSELINNRLVRPGDRIDLLSTFEMEIGQQAEGVGGPVAESVALMQNLEVHAIIIPINTEDVTPDMDEAQNSEESGVFRTTNQLGQSVLLAMDTQDALVVRHVLDIGGVVDLALRAPEDDSLADTVPVNQYYLADRYQIETRR